jgi:hypothetical protein
MAAARAIPAAKLQRPISRSLPGGHIASVFCDLTGTWVAPAERDAIFRSAFSRFVSVFASFLFKALNHFPA